jgi:hypothetical protein
VDLETTVLKHAQGSALVSLIVFAVLAVWRGWLVPRAIVDKLDTLHERQLAESMKREAEWRAAWQTSETARQLLAEHVNHLVELAETTDVIVRALQDQARKP